MGSVRPQHFFPAHTKTPKTSSGRGGSNVLATALSTTVTRRGGSTRFLPHRFSVERTARSDLTLTASHSPPGRLKSLPSEARLFPPTAPPLPASSPPPSSAAGFDVATTRRTASAQQPSAARSGIRPKGTKTLAEWKTGYKYEY